MNKEESPKKGKEISSISELAKQLENKTINPAGQRKGDLKKCADLFKSRGYSNTDIAEILDVDEKTVQRYIKDQREENALAISSNFQKQIIGEVVRDWHKQYYRLLRLSYSEGITANEVMKAIYLAHQVEKDGVELLERLGYLSKSVGIDDIKAELAIEEKRKEAEKQLKPLAQALAKIEYLQGHEVHQFLTRRYEEVELEAIEMAENIFAENEKKKLASGGGTTNT
jgi:transposase